MRFLTVYTLRQQICIPKHYGVQKRTEQEGQGEGEAAGLRHRTGDGAGQVAALLNLNNFLLCLIYYCFYMAFSLFCDVALTR